MSRKTNILPTKLSNKQRHTLNYWSVATKEIENTCLSVLNLLYRNADYVNYLRYQQQFQNFKDTRNILSGIVFATVETDNLFFMESVTVDAVKQLLNMIAISSTRNRSTIGKTTVCTSRRPRMYNEIALIIIKCMLILKKKLLDVDEYLGKIQSKQIKNETEVYKVVKKLDAFANRLNFMLKMTLKGRHERNEEIAKSVFQSIELIITAVQKISLDKRRMNCNIQPSVSSSPCVPVENKDRFLQRTRNVWSLVQEERRTLSTNTSAETFCFVEHVLNDDNLRYRDKLKAVKERMKCSTKYHQRSDFNPSKQSKEFDLPLTYSQDDELPYGWIHPTDEQIEEYICKNGGCPTSTLQTNRTENQTINVKQRFTLKELVNIFPVDTQHLRFPPNPSNASVFLYQAQNRSETNAVDEDLLEGLLWQWHEVSDSESTISIRFKFEMSDSRRRERWFQGYRRVLQLDPDRAHSLQTEIAMAKQSKSCQGPGPKKLTKFTDDHSVTTESKY